MIPTPSNRPMGQPAVGQGGLGDLDGLGSRGGQEVGVVRVDGGTKVIGVVEGTKVIRVFAVIKVVLVVSVVSVVRALIYDK